MYLLSDAMRENQTKPTFCHPTTYLLRVEIIEENCIISQLLQRYCLTYNSFGEVRQVVILYSLVSTYSPLHFCLPHSVFSDQRIKFNENFNIAYFGRARGKNLAFLRPIQNFATYYITKWVFSVVSHLSLKYFGVWFTHTVYLFTNEFFYRI